MDDVDQQRLMIKVARLYHTHGMRQTDIAKRLQISQSRVSRLLTQAEEASIVRTVVAVPPHIHAEKVLFRIDPRKDVDGFHPLNVGKVVLGDPTGFRPATPYGVQQILLRSGIETRGAHVVIVGRSNLVGKPLANMLSRPGVGGDATVTIAHSRTRDLPGVCRAADILVVAMGRAEFIGADAVRPGATVIDVGTSRVADATRPKGFRLAGDVAFEAVREVAGAITPVPGGVGPMTIAMLLVNTVQAATLFADSQ